MTKSRQTYNYTPRRTIRLSDDDWSRLEQIAISRGLEWGGIPSRSDAVRVLIADWIAAQHPGPTE